jgi:hypothetical protein
MASVFGSPGRRWSRLAIPKSPTSESFVFWDDQSCSVAVAEVDGVEVVVPLIAAAQPHTGELFHEILHAPFYQYETSLREQDVKKPQTRSIIQKDAE